MKWKSSCKHKLRQPLEIGAAFSGMALAPLLPRRALLRLADGLAGAAYRLDKRSRMIARANLRAVMPEAGDTRHTEIIRGSFSTISRTFLDLFWFSRHHAERLKRHVVFDESFDIVLRQTPLIAVCAHFGNWEVIGQAGCLAGVPAVSVATPLQNKVLDGWLRDIRTRSGQQIVERAGAARGLLRALRNKHLIALLLDQNTRIKDGGVWVHFFGLPVAVSGIVELLSRRTGTPVINVYGYPLPNGDYRAVAGAPINVADAGATPNALTAALMLDLESRIREHPELWLWMYKRWKYIPPEADSAGYPDYAKPMSP